MRQSALLVAALVSATAFSTTAVAGPAEDAAAAVTGVLDKFNAGDIDSFFAAHRDGAVIIDEFAPYVWGGPGSAQRWAADYARDAEARGISGGRIDYSPPVHAASDGGGAYIVLPTIYRFAQNGAKMAGSGSMTFVMGRVGKDWKISSWTYSGASPAPE